MAGLRTNDAGVGEGIHAAVREGGAHDGEVVCGDVEGALAGVEVYRLGRVCVDAPEVLEEAGDRLVAVVGSGGGLQDLRVQAEGSAGEL